MTKKWWRERKLLSRVMCVWSHSGQHQGCVFTQSQLFPHAVHTAAMLLQENVRGTHCCDGLSSTHSSCIPGEPGRDKPSKVSGQHIHRGALLISMGHTQPGSAAPHKHTPHRAKALNPPPRAPQAHWGNGSGKGRWTSVKKLTDVSSSCKLDREVWDPGIVSVGERASESGGLGSRPWITPRSSYSKAQPKDGLENALGPVCGEIFCQLITQPVLLICSILVSRAT